ncbi:MAG: hypothetical protein RIQ88_167 [Actinomycetota bacterium]
MNNNVILALGSNLGNRRQWLIRALAELVKSRKVTLEKVSAIFESKALTLSGVDSTKPKYLNCVAEVKTDLKPEALLALIQSVESKLGRKRKERWGDRNIDIDIIKFGNIHYRSKDLQIPHPEAAKRAFVIVPWYCMDTEAELPGVGKLEKLAILFADQVKLK